MNRTMFATAAAAVLLTACMSLPDKITGPTVITAPAAALEVTAPSTTNTPGGFPITYPPLVKDLKSATENLDHAVAIGALPSNDPAQKCFHNILILAGIELPPGAAEPKSFEPKKDGLVSAAAIAYIVARQEESKRPLVVSPDCKALLGAFVIDAAKEHLNVLGAAARIGARVIGR